MPQYKNETTGKLLQALPFPILVGYGGGSDRRWDYAGDTVDCPLYHKSCDSPGKSAADDPETGGADAGACGSGSLL